MSIRDIVRKAFTSSQSDEKPQHLKSWGDDGTLEMVSNRARDLSPHAYGFAQSYAVIEAVRSCIDTYADLIENMPYRVVWNAGYDPAEDKVIAVSSDVQVRTPIQAALRRYRKRYNISLFRRLAYSTLIWDESYIELIRDDMWNASDLRWLNPLGVQRNEFGGEILGFMYSFNGETYTHFTTNEIAYDHGFNPYDDNAGMSIVLSVLNEINIDYNLKAFLRDVFTNNARPGVLAWIDDPNYVNNEQLRKSLEDTFRLYAKGKGNQGRTIFSPVKLGVQTFEFPDMDKNLPVMQAMRAQVFAGFGVPMSIVGDTASTRYKESLDARANFVQTKVKPLLLRFQDYINDCIMPFFDPTRRTRLEFDTSAYDLLTELDQQKATMITGDLQAGLITIGQAQEARGYAPDDRIANYYLINGVPVPPEQITELWRYQFAAPANMGEDVPQLTLPTVSEMASIPEREPPEPHKSTCNCDHCNPEAPLPYRALFDSSDGIYPDDETIHALQHEELKAWYAYLKKRNGKASRQFVCNVIEPFVQYAVIDRLDSDMPLDVAILDVWQDESTKTKVSYRQRARNIARQIYEGRLSRGDAVNQFQELVAREFEAAFRRGLRDANMAWDDLTNDERNELTALIRKETSYVYPLIDDIFRHPKGESLEPIRNRIELWVSRLDRVEQYGLLVASGDQKMVWRYDPRKEHCGDCLYLHGKVYRASTWLTMDIQPQSPKLECFGTFCGCKLVPTDAPVTRGRPARW